MNTKKQTILKRNIPSFFLLCLFAFFLSYSLSLADAASDAAGEEPGGTNNPTTIENNSSNTSSNPDLDTFSESADNPNGNGPTNNIAPNNSSNNQNTGNGAIPTDGTVYGDKNTKPESDPNNFSLVWGCNGGKLPRVGGCTIEDAIQQIQKLVNYGFYMSIIIMGLLIAYAGILYMTASFQGEKNTKDAKAIFTNTVKAFLFAAAAWAIVHFVLDFLVSSAFKSQVDKLIQ